jgi:hypothetical protein
MASKVDFGKLSSTRLGWRYRKCGKKLKARSRVLDMDVVICSAAADRVEETTGGMTLSGINGGTKMARRKRGTYVRRGKNCYRRLASGKLKITKKANCSRRKR